MDCSGMLPSCLLPHFMYTYFRPLVQGGGILSVCVHVAAMLCVLLLENGACGFSSEEGGTMVAHCVSGLVVGVLW